MKLNVGSGYRRMKGYENIDIEPGNNPDICADFRTLHFSDVEAIRASHILEHFGRDEFPSVLGLWHSWLKVGGTLRIETPDLEGICENFKNAPEWSNRHLYGSQEAPWALHKDGWWEAKFRKVLPRFGFKVTEVTRFWGNKRKGLADIAVVAVKL